MIGDGIFLVAMVKDAAAVPRPSVGVDTHTDQALRRYCAQQRRRIVERQLHVACDAGDSWIVGLAHPGPGGSATGVGRGLQVCDALFHCVVVRELSCSAHAATAATAILRVRRARRDLLRGERRHRAGGLRHHGLDGSYGGECPTTAARALRSYRGDDARRLIPPVHGDGQLVHILALLRRHRLQHDGSFRPSSVTEKTLHLLGPHVRQWAGARGPRPPGPGVELREHREALLEEGLALGALFAGVRFAVGGAIGIEVERRRRGRGDGGQGGEARERRRHRGKMSGRLRFPSLPHKTTHRCQIEAQPSAESA
mmetsp:Transcript_51921/g.149701  ORF Transcript_51921/g.149701 Transcript_51921/m.149701 type:complete len:312 (-) Transcript_51921:2-937(-)